MDSHGKFKSCESSKLLSNRLRSNHPMNLDLMDGKSIYGSAKVILDICLIMF